MPSYLNHKLDAKLHLQLLSASLPGNPSKIMRILMGVDRAVARNCANLMWAKLAHCLAKSSGGSVGVVLRPWPQTPAQLRGQDQGFVGTWTSIPQSLAGKDDECLKLARRMRASDSILLTNGS